MMKLKIECDTEEERRAADEFIGWLSNQGEQDYWTAIECQDPGNPFIRTFKYHNAEKLEVELELSEKGENPW